MAIKKRRRTFTKEFKAKVARQALRDVEPINAIAAQHGVSPCLVRDWRKQAENSLPNAFGATPKAEAKQDAEIKNLHARIGELTMALDFFCQASKP